MTQGVAQPQTKGSSDVSELETLRRERDEAVAAREAALEMLATFTHELRTPLTGIVGITNILLGAPLGVEQRHYLRTLWSTGAHLRRLVDDVVDLSLLESRGYRLEPAPASPGEVVREVLDMVSPEAQKKRIGLSWLIGCELEADFMVDADRLRQVLLNLAANAVRYTDRGAVRIEAALGAGPDGETRAVFTVTDTGMGMSEDVLKYLFCRFTRAGPPDLRGAGLGLAISSQIVALVGGRIEVESAPGEGSRFSVTVPMAPAGDATETDPAVSSGERGCERASLKLLLAEDDELNRMYFELLLGAGGHEVTAVGDGRAVIEALERGSFDAVLMDVHMPVMDGIAAVKAIRALLGERGRIPVIALTGGVGGQTSSEFQTCGFSDCLTKPLDNGALARALADATGRPVHIPSYAVDASEIDGAPEDAGKTLDAFLEESGLLEDGLK